MFAFLGGTFLMIGAVVGGGILAIPIVSAQYGFLTTIMFIILSWGIMTKTGLYILELCMQCPEKFNSYYSIVGKFLGEKVRFITMLLFLWLLYFSLASYISGCVSIILSFLTSSHHPLLSYFNISLLYVLIFGCLIVISVKIIVRLNVLIVALKLGLLILAIASSSSFYSAFSLGAVTLHKAGAFSLLLIIINAFGFQFIVPSLVSYYGREKEAQFKGMLIASTSIVLILYIAWLCTIYAIIPLHGEYGLLSISQSQNQLKAFNASLMFHMHSTWMIYLISTFESVALFGSFFCVSIGVFDFFMDVFKAKSRKLVGMITFTPPLVLSLCSQNMYVYAMSAAGYIAVILEIVIPIWAKRIQAQEATAQPIETQNKLVHLD